MKKILFLGLIVSLFAFQADAQERKPDQKKRAEIQRTFKKDKKDMKGKKFSRTDRMKKFQKMKHHRKNSEYARAKRMALRDGKISPKEKKMLEKMRKNKARRTVRYKA